MDHVIDLRSDTVTQPTPAMRAAMASAEVGDDVFGEDPTVNRLESMAAAMLGKEAAVFVASGTMGNLTSVLAHCERGQEAILGDESHIWHYEAGGASALGGVVLHTVPTRADGTMPLAALEAAVRPSAHNHNFHHFAPAGLICLENTHNRCGGAVVSPDYFAEVAALAARYGLPIHLDGARLFNAAVARGVPVTAWTAHGSSIQICLSKGLSAPVGSLVVGSASFALRARRIRKMIGGGMRQAGVLAAAGIVGLSEMVERLDDDHRHARALAVGLAALPGIEIDPATVDTNIVVVTLASAARAEAFAARLSETGVKVSNFGGGRLRFVTHHGITAADCERAVEAAGRVARLLP